MSHADPMTKFQSCHSADVDRDGRPVSDIKQDNHHIVPTVLFLTSLGDAGVRRLLQTDDEGIPCVEDKDDNGFSAAHAQHLRFIVTALDFAVSRRTHPKAREALAALQQAAPAALWANVLPSRSDVDQRLSGPPSRSSSQPLRPPSGSSSQPLCSGGAAAESSRVLKAMILSLLLLFGCCGCLILRKPLLLSSSASPISTSSSSSYLSSPYVTKISSRQPLPTSPLELSLSRTTFVPYSAPSGERYCDGRDEKVALLNGPEAAVCIPPPPQFLHERIVSRVDFSDLAPVHFYTTNMLNRAMDMYGSSHEVSRNVELRVMQMMMERIGALCLADLHVMELAEGGDKKLLLAIPSTCRRYDRFAERVPWPA